jgi:uncharacterized DUF497 family protein
MAPAALLADAFACAKRPEAVASRGLKLSRQMPNIPAAGFDWDEGNRAKCAGHGVSQTEIEALLRGNPGVAPDPRHSHVEDRFIAVGRNATGRPMFVAFTIRTRAGRQLIRPITARYMHAKEIRAYEAQGSETQK